jgi:hypothetical protein
MGASISAVSFLTGRTAIRVGLWDLKSWATSLRGVAQAVRRRNNGTKNNLFSLKIFIELGSFLIFGKRTWMEQGGPILLRMTSKNQRLRETYQILSSMVP